MPYDLMSSVTKPLYAAGIQRRNGIVSARKPKIVPIANLGQAAARKRLQLNASGALNRSLAARKAVIGRRKLGMK